MDDSAPRRTTRRVIAVMLLAAVIVAGLAVHALLPDAAVTDIAGDSLYAGAAYLAVVIVAPRLAPLSVGALAAAWCIVIEFFQLTGIPMQLGAIFPPSMLVFGTVFDGRDLLVYVVTIVVLVGADAVVAVLRGTSTADPRRAEESATPT